MIMSYSNESSMTQAFQETFSGDRPCELCNVIDSVESGQSEQPAQQARDKSGLNLMLGLGRTIVLSAPTHRRIHFSTFEEILIVRSGEVATPPPRLGLVQTKTAPKGIST